ncbi:hypothetical protein SCYAM73S_01278 [Streptomyces cyaneofuscatus]
MRTEFRSGQGFGGRAHLDQLRFGAREYGELGAGHPGPGMALEADRDPVELGDRVEQGAGVDVVRQQPGGGGDDAGAEVADGQLPELADEYGHAEGRQVDLDQGDPVALQDRADGVEPAFVLGPDAGGVEGDHISVLFEQQMHVADRQLQDLGFGGLEQGRGRCLLIGGRQHQICTRHCYCGRHALPRSAPAAVETSAAIAPAPCSCPSTLATSHQAENSYRRPVRHHANTVRTGVGC